MRVSGGAIRGFRLRSLRGAVLRPTAEKVKEAIFNVLGPKVIGANVADIFAGTGNIGIEALSRGAAHVLFVERHLPSVRLLKNNLTTCGLTHKALVYTMDASGFLRRAARQSMMFDILYADPPYHTPVAERFLRQLGKSDIMSESGIVVIEHFQKKSLPDKTGCLSVLKRYRYGDTLLSFYEFSTAGERVG
jgi:16S rRNA (guanine966-N2)-methyltransferase